MQPTYTYKNAISIVVPTLNEEENVKSLVERIHNALTTASLVYEIIFIDDHSKDKTVSILKSLDKKYPIRVKAKQGKPGKAYSLLEGFALATYDVIAMIDADLQYAPEEIPKMFNKLSADCDVVQSYRSTQGLSFLRKFLSWGFNTFFIRIMHGMRFDTQSGLKVFKRKIIQEIAINPTRWTFDLAFLLQARNAGYKIISHDIVFEDRKGGESKISVKDAVYEIGSNAVKLKFKGIDPVAISSNQNGMLGAGQAYNGKRFITHSTLPHEISAIKTLVTWQKVFIFLVLLVIAAGFIISPRQAAVVVVSILSAIYFIDVLFNFYLVKKSLMAPPELSFTTDEIARINDDALPVYSILCPLFKEAHILPGFVTAIEKLDWPKDKLDVLLLLEENDPETITAARSMDLPNYFRVVVVPHSEPKTKPKACNYGLSKARGEYLVIYDAEDVPEPSQLKKAYLGFGKVPQSVMCLQAKLNYFNPHHNLLTRLFTAEYSLWFDVILPGLQSINGYIPLGGTSNHFRTKDLLLLRGWDPFNVTEDCDLGARLFKRGTTTAIIDSTTLEEANSNLKNWIRQRSRWIKGYMQTYLVHMRNPIQFFKGSGIHALVFQLVVGGKISFMIINPILWVLTISYFAFRATVGPTIEALFPPAVFYIAVVSLVCGNFLCLYYYMIGCAKRGHWTVIKYVFLVPIYWLFTSVAALMALYQLIVKPHFWEKTNHGLHLKKNQVFVNTNQPVAPVILPQPVPAMPVAGRTYWFTKYVNNSLVSKSTFFVIALSAANGINFVFNAFLGRVLSFDQIAIVTFVNTLWYIATMFISSYGSTINHKVASFAASDKDNHADAFYGVSLKKALMISVVLSVVWLILSPITAKFFNINDPLTLVLFTPILTFGIIMSANIGYLQGRLHLGFVSAIYLTEALSKLAVAIVLVMLGYKDYVYLAIPFSVMAAAFMANFMLPKMYASKVSPEPFPRDFYVASIINGLFATFFLSLDVVMVKHFLANEAAGEYLFLSLVGKIVYFFGSLPNNLMITLVSREMGKNHNPNRVLYALLGVAGFFVAVGYLGLGVFGSFTIPLLLGTKILAVLPYTQSYVLAMSLFTLANVLVTYHLSRKQYAFPIVAFMFSLVMALAISLNHEGIGDIVNMILYTSAAALAVLFVMHLLEPKFKFISRSWIDFIEILQPAKILPPMNESSKRILIFNWRDIKHTFAGGAEVYIHEMAKRWVMQGHKVTLFCGNDNLSLRNETVDGIETVRRGGFYMVYFWAFFYYMFRFRGKYDVIIDCQNGIPFFTPMYAKEPIYCVMHHVHQEIFRRYLIFPLAMLAQCLEKYLMPFVYRNIKFITVSQSTKRQMEDLGLVGQGIEIVHNGVDLKELEPGKKATDPMVLYLGRLKAYKSVDVLIKAFKQVQKEVPTARLVIAGCGEEDQNLVKLAQDIGLGSAVEFVGRVDEKKKIKLLQSAWVFVNPSFIEGWGITTIEANACGTPVIGADVPGLQDSIRTPVTGYLVEHGNVQILAHRIVSVLCNNDIRKEMGKHAYEWATNFDWSKTSQDFFNAISVSQFSSSNVYVGEGNRYE